MTEAQHRATDACDEAARGAAALGRTMRVGQMSVFRTMTLFTAPDAPRAGGSPGRNARKRPPPLSMLQPWRR